LGRALREASGLVLVDCLTLWVSNCLWPPGRPASRRWRFSGFPPLRSGREAADTGGWRRERDDFLAALGAYAGEVIIVSNEVGTGIVPDNTAARVFRDEHGWLNQEVAAICDEVYFVTAGLPMCLKASQTEPGRTATPLR
jgi:adenosylcobinamide kinase / adenosylcobinamide-phosphate guanylyltransferase